MGFRGVRVISCLALMVALLAAGPVPSHAAPSGSPAPPFKLDLFTGKALQLADLKGTAVIVLFWAEW